MKKANLFKTLVLSVAFQAAAMPAAIAQEKPPEPARADRYASIVVDASTGQTLYERDGDQQLRPASTTKIMTAYLTFEALRAGRLRLDQELTVSSYAAGQSRTNLAMIRGVAIKDKKTGKTRTVQRQVVQKITVEDALKGMLVHSANDAAVVLAEAIGGSVSGFATQMNATATRLGMDDTQFMNPNGMPHNSQYTTVTDMAKLSAAVIKDFPEYYHFFSVRNFTYRGTTYRNYNNLLGSYDGVDGLKTGYIHTSGYNLAATAQRDGTRVIGVVFGATNPAQRKADMTVLLDYGFAVLGSQPKPPLNDSAEPADTSGEPEDAIDTDTLPPAKESDGTGFSPAARTVPGFIDSPLKMQFSSQTGPKPVVVAVSAPPEKPEGPTPHKEPMTPPRQTGFVPAFRSRYG